MKQNHFTAVVIGDDHNNIMANYDKCTNVTKSIVMEFSKADTYRANYLKYYKALLNNPELIKEFGENGEIELNEMIKSIENNTDEELFEWIAYTYGYNIDAETGDLYKMENPYGKFDQCNVGRKYSLPLITNDGKEVYSEKKKNINWSEIHLNNTKPYEIAWDTVVEGIKPNGEYEERIYENMKNRKEYFLKYGTRENYIMSSTAFWGYAYVDKYGWIELEDNEDQFKWVTNFYKRFIEPLDDEETITIYECIRN